ncbi:MAG: hypothetical protein RIB03_08870 [Henriciella sp.]|uniref:hypothetical protein n=1 Tax=Henriciella sp. TaxID=1968823 RepID=UPI0032F03E9C
MTHTDDPRRAMTAMAISVFTLFLVMMGFAIAKKTGFLDPDLARRGAAATIGLMLAVSGNFVPKLRLFQPEGGSATPVDRFAGWVFVLCGLGFAAVWLFAPLQDALVASPMIGAAGFLLVLARWIGWQEKPAHRGLPRLTAGRLTLAMLLVSILWTFAIFFADTIWGDAVAQWMAISFTLVLGGAIPFVVLKVARSAAR